LELDAINKMYGLAEESFRAAEATWSTAFEAAQRTSETRLWWDFEDAAWQAYGAADAVRQAAWQFRSGLTAQSRRQVRDRVLSKPVEPFNPPEPSSPTTA